MAHPRMERLASGLLAARWVLLGAGMVLVALAWQPARQLSFDRSIENMFAEDDPLLPPYRLLKRTFGGNEIALAAYVDPEALQPAGLERIARLTQRLERAGAPLGERQRPVERRGAHLWLLAGIRRRLDDEWHMAVSDQTVGRRQ